MKPRVAGHLIINYSFFKTKLQMQKKNLNFRESCFPATTAGSARLPYLSPEVEVQQIELEGDCLATASVGAAGASNPQVNDWNADTTPTDPGNTGDLSL